MTQQTSKTSLIMSDEIVKCTRCRYKHRMSDRVNKYYPKTGFTVSVCPKCSGHSVYKFGVQAPGLNVSEKTMPSKAEFDEIKKRLSNVCGEGVYLLIDGYYIAANVIQLGMQLKIAVYVNGYMKGIWNWNGRANKLDEMSEISRRFYCLSVRNLYNAKEMKLWEKIYGSKAKAKANGIYEQYYSVALYFSSATAFINHIKKNNDEIRLLSADEYHAAALTDFIGVQTPGLNEVTQEVEHAA